MSKEALVKENLDIWKDKLGKNIISCPPITFAMLGFVLSGKSAEAYLLSTFLSRASKIDYKTITNIYQDFTYKLTYKTKQAEMNGKNILVAIGEEHSVAQSFLLETLLLSALKFNGFNHLMTETMSPSYYVASFARDVLGYKVESIGIKDPVLSRDDAINKNISNVEEKKSVLIVGFNHLDHINLDPEIDKKYEIFNVDLTLKNSKASEILDAYQDNFNDQGDIFYPKIESNLEQFSLEQLLLIYEDFLPYIYDNVSPSDSDSKVYEANMDTVMQDCLVYKIAIL